MTVPFCSFSPPTVLPLAAFDRPGQIMTAKQMTAKWTDGQTHGHKESSVREKVHRAQMIFFHPHSQSPSTSSSSVSSRNLPPDAAAKRSRGNSFLLHRISRRISQITRVILLTCISWLSNYTTTWSKLNLSKIKLWKARNIKTPSHETINQQTWFYFWKITILLDRTHLIFHSHSIRIKLPRSHSPAIRSQMILLAWLAVEMTLPFVATFIEQDFCQRFIEVVRAYFPPFFLNYSTFSRDGAASWLSGTS